MVGVFKHVPFPIPQNRRMIPFIHLFISLALSLSLPPYMHVYIYIIYMYVCMYVMLCYVMWCDVMWCDVLCYVMLCMYVCPYLYLHTHTYIYILSIFLELFYFQNMGSQPWMAPQVARGRCSCNGTTVLVGCTVGRRARRSRAGSHVACQGPAVVGPCSTRRLGTSSKHWGFEMGFSMGFPARHVWGQGVKQCKASLWAVRTW